MTAAKRDPVTGLMLLAALILLGFGLFMPAVTVEKFYIFDNTKSIAGSIEALFLEGHVLLGIIVAAFSLVFPLVKLVLSFRIWTASNPASPGVQRAIRWTVMLGKWSMLDVFMAALVVAILTLGMVASVEVHVGLYVFGGAIVLAMLGSHRLEASLAQKDGA